MAGRCQRQQQTRPARQARAMAFIAVIVASPLGLSDAQHLNATACPAVATCLGVPACSACLTALMPNLEPVQGFGVRGPLQVAFFATLTEPLCTSGGTVHPEAVRALCNMYEYDCFGNDTWVDPCEREELNCALDTNCRECLSGVYAASSDSRDALNSAACNSTDVDQLKAIAFTATNCDQFPQCTFWKQECYSSAHCSGCVATLRSGDGTAAAQQCPFHTVNDTRSTFGDFLGLCAIGALGECDYFWESCFQERACNQCFAAMDRGQTSPQRIAEAYLSPSCDALRHNITAHDLVEDIFRVCPLDVYDPCQFIAGLFTLSSGQPFAECVIDPSSSSNCQALLADLTEVCQPCADSVLLNNRIVLATAIVGGLSILPCLVVILLIVAYGKDRMYTRSRVIIGLTLANIIYSSSNAIPVNMLQTGVNTCGTFALSYATVRFGRAWWFCGKYMLVGFELFILGASVWALTRGSRELGFRREAVCHALCVVAGAAAFTGFLVQSTDIMADGYNGQTLQEMSGSHNYLNASDDLDDDRPEVAAASRYSSARNEYDALVQRMLQVWAGLLGLAMIMWVCLRLLFVKLTRAWSTSLAEAERQWDRDLWAPDQQGARRTKRRVLEIVKEGYDELARPLEPFVAVFALFGVPAIVMATDYCQSHSEIQTTFGWLVTSVGTCDVWCELALSFRSAATVAVYFYSREHRMELLHARTAWWRLRARVGGWFAMMSGSRHGSGVRFRALMLEEVQIIPPNDDNDDGFTTVDAAATDGVDERGAASKLPYQLMGGDDDVSSTVGSAT